MQIKLIVGLGNPGKEYEHTRHNMGFLFIDRVVKVRPVAKGDLKKDMPNFYYPVDALENGFENKKIILAKTQVFINKSGTAVLALVKQFKIKPENVLVVHDDIDILWGDFKFSFGRSSAGHKGIESIIKSLKTKNFWRLRIGIQPKVGIRIKADKIILKKFAPKELRELDKTIKNAISELEIA